MMVAIDQSNIIQPGIAAYIRHTIHTEANYLIEGDL